MTLIQLLHRRQKLDGDTFGKTLYGVGFDVCCQDEFNVKKFQLRFLLARLHDAHTNPAA